MREGKHEHRNERFSILELLRQDAITRDEYKQLNTMLAESLDEKMVLEPPDSEEKDELKKMIQAYCKKNYKYYCSEIFCEKKKEVKTNGGESLIEISNWFVGGSRNGAHSFWHGSRVRDLNLSECVYHFSVKFIVSFLCFSSLETVARYTRPLCLLSSK